MQPQHHLLIIDSDQSSRDTWKSFLPCDKKDSSEILEASSIQEALQHCLKGQVDCILLNFMSPGISFIQFLTELNKNNLSFPMILLASDSSETDIVRSIECGLYDCLSKEDITSEKVDELIRNSIDRYQVSEQIKDKNMNAKDFVYHDYLTKLPNRLYFETTVEKEFAHTQRHKRNMALLFIDLDNFKNVNDSFGHHVGDALLCEAAERLRQSLRKEDIIARLGGDEFGIMIRDIKKPTDAGIVASKIIESVINPYHIDDIDVQVGISIGIASYNDSIEDVETLMRNADIAMYNIKKKGGNNYEYHSEEMTKQHMKDLSLRNDFMFALEKNEMKVLYQPQFDLLNDHIIGMEAKVRWHHPKLGVLHPDVFIPIADDMKKIIPLGNWVLETACQQYTSWFKDDAKKCKLALNISCEQLMHGELSDRVVDVLNRYNMLPEQLELEIREQSLMRESQEAVANMQKLNELGVALTIDYFGTGYSSLSHLRNLPISSVKIDKSYIETIDTDERQAELVNSIIGLARSLNMRVVAEGVQTIQQKLLLAESRCGFGQGNLYSPPLDSSQMSQYLQSL